MTRPHEQLQRPTVSQKYTGRSMKTDRQLGGIIYQISPAAAAR
jgi:hypothetical protein